MFNAPNDRVLHQNPVLIAHDDRALNQILVLITPDGRTHYNVHHPDHRVPPHSQC